MSSTLKRKNTAQIVTRSRSKKIKQKINAAKEPKPWPKQEANIPDSVQKITKLSEINEDCQIEIFRHCSIDDLLNAVEYDTKLGSAARWVFGQKTKDKYVCFSNEIDTDKHKMQNKQIKMLNHFGANIDGIKLVYDNEYRHFDYIIEKAINNRCYQTLKSLRVENANRHSLFDIKKPFRSVRKLQFSGGTLNHMISKMNKWFPNANKLRISNFVFPRKNLHTLEPNRCQALSELQIRSNPIVESGYAKWATDFVVMNPQLTKLSVTYNGQMMTELSMRKPNLSTLHLEIIPNRYHEISAVHFQKLMKLTYRGQVSKLNVTADEIGTLDISLRWLMSNDLYELIRSRASVNRINIYPNWHGDSNPDKIIEQIKHVVNLKELSFPAHDSISTKVIFDLVEHCKTLKWLLIHADTANELPVIKQRLGAEWVMRKRNITVNNIHKIGFIFNKI